MEKRREKGTHKLSQDREKMPGDSNYCLSCAIYNGDPEGLKNALDSHELFDSQVWSMGLALLRNTNCRSRLTEFLLERGAKTETPFYWNGIPLCHPVGMDNIQIMESLLKCDTKFEAFHYRYGTQISHAVRSDNIQITKSLLQTNHDIIKPKLDDYLVPVSMAALLDDTGKAKVLLDHIYCNDTSPFSGNAMNNLETVKSLLHGSVNVNERLYIHLTGFDTALRLADQEISEVLANPLPFETLLHADFHRGRRFRACKGEWTTSQQIADVEARSHENLTGLHFAAQISDLEGAKIFLDHGADTSTLCPWALDGLLIRAIHRCKEALVKLLVEKGANVNSNDKERGTPLKAAVPSPCLFKFLLSKGADIDARDKDNKNMLHRAVENNDLSLIELIIEAHSDPKSPMDKTQSEILEEMQQCGFGLSYFYKKDCEILLHKAIEKGHIGIVEYLLKLGTNFNVESKAENGDTPLHSAVKNGHFEIATLLINNKADVNAKNRDGATPLHCAFDHTPKYSADKATAISSLISARKRTETIIKILLDKGTSVNAKKTDGTTVLGCAAKRGHTEAFKLLIENGADIITDRSGDGETLLHTAAAGWSSEIVEIVLNTFDDVDCRNGLGQTALHVAVSRARIPTVCLLLDHDSDINILDDDSCTPLDYTNSWDYGYDEQSEEMYLFGHKFDGHKKIAMIFKQHIVEMVALDRYVSDRNLQAIISFDNYEPVHDQCKNEIECMREKKISVTNVSYYDVLTKDMKQLALYARNQHIVDALETGLHQHMFRRYSGMLHNRFKKGQKRAILLDSMGNSLSSLTGYDLPYYVTAKLFYYLSNEDVNNLIKAGFDGEFFKFLDAIWSAESRDC